MKTRLLNTWESWRANYWFVPTLMALLSVGLAFTMIELDQQIDYKKLRGFWWIYGGGSEGARAVLAAIATSMITVAGVVFSITIVALTLASQQFGPRLLRNFMRDTGNQVVLGTFIATFVYCLLVLRTIRGLDDNEFVPHVSVSFGVLLAVGSIAVLIYFIHHIAASIQANNVIATVADELQGAIDHLFPERLGDAPSEKERNFEELIPDIFEASSRVIPAARNGYLQAIENEQIMQLAQQHNLLLRLEHRPGAFVAVGTPLALAWPANHLVDDQAEALGRAFLVGPQRTTTQDAEFIVQQLVEIAVRALSPGINDPFTAITCLDWLGAALSQLAERKIPSRYRCDDKGQLRIIADVTTFKMVMATAFDQIRQNGCSHTVVIVHLLQTMSVIARKLQAPEQHSALQQQADATLNLARKTLHAEADRAAIEERYRAVGTALRRAKQNSEAVTE